MQPFFKNYFIKNLKIDENMLHILTRNTIDLKLFRKQNKCTVKEPQKINK